MANFTIDRSEEDWGILHILEGDDLVGNLYLPCEDDTRYSVRGFSRYPLIAHSADTEADAIAIWYREAAKAPR